MFADCSFLFAITVRSSLVNNTIKKTKKGICFGEKTSVFCSYGYNVPLHAAMDTMYLYMQLWIQCTCTYSSSCQCTFICIMAAVGTKV